MGRIGFGPDGTKLVHNLSVENENQEQWNGKAQNEGINCEDLLTSNSLKRNTKYFVEFSIIT